MLTKDYSVDRTLEDLEGRIAHGIKELNSHRSKVCF
jgi:hypothetical protein